MSYGLFAPGDDGAYAIIGLALLFCNPCEVGRGRDSSVGRGTFVGGSCKEIDSIQQKWQAEIESSVHC